MKYGRLPRAFSPAVPHWSALKMGAPAIDVPSVCSYTARLPADLGVMLNDRLGDCGEAGYAMTSAFRRAWVDEAYALVSPVFCEASGLTPLGQTIEFWDQQMVAIRGAA